MDKQKNTFNGLATNVCFSFPESEEPDHDNQLMGGAVLERLQAEVGPGRVRRRQAVACSQRPHLET